MLFCFSVTVSTSNKQFGFSKIIVKQSTPRVSTILEAFFYPIPLNNSLDKKSIMWSLSSGKTTS